MSNNTKRKLINGCFVVAAVLFSTLTPISAKAASTDVQSSVTRIGGFDQYETAAQMAQKGWPGTSVSVVLSAGMKHNLVDALSAGPLAAKLNAPILLTDGGQKLNLFAKAELERLKPEKVYLTSGTAVIKPAVIDEIIAMGITTVVPLGGYDQYETSINIAKELANQGVNSSRFILAGGWASPADALSIAPIAAAQGIPILTTTQGQLPDSVKTYLDSIKAKVTEAYVIGGTAVVSDAVKNELPGKVSRFSGITKYDTNIQVLKGFAKEYKNDKVFVANGESLVDALAGVPLAAITHSPVVLVNQELNEATMDFVKKNISTDNMVALGGEAAVPSAGMDAMISAVSYTTDNVTEGSTNSAKPNKLIDNVRITGNNVILRNANAVYSVYLKGDNITLRNLTVKGTVFVDPGDQGTATLDGVTAGNIVILSGAKDSIHLINTKGSVLTVDSSSDVRVESTGTTTIGNTVVRSFAVIDAQGGSLGDVIISSAGGQNPVVELRGTFTWPVVVEGSATVRAAIGANFTLQISPKNTDQAVTLEGTFKTVTLSHQAHLHLSASAVITDLIANAIAYISIDQGAKVTSFDNKGNTVEITGSGATAIPGSNQIIPSGPAVTPPGPTPSNPQIPDTATISNLHVVTENGNVFSTFNNGSGFDLSELDGKVKVLGFGLTVDQDCTLKLSVRGITQIIPLIAGEEKIVTADILIGLPIVGGVALDDFRITYTTKTLVGQLLRDETSVGSFTVNLKFK